jgi:hypothetical protein
MLLRFLVCLLAAFLPSVLTASAQKARWISQTDSDVVFIFVHGVLSSSDDGWKHTDGTFWPELVASTGQFKKPNVYVGGYPTSVGDPSFGIEQAALHLFGTLSRGDPAPLSKQEIIFVAHSTGGLVVRQMLLNETATFANKKVGLFLLASPSRGSEWAERVRGLSNLLNHKMISELRTNSGLLVSMDKRFSELLARRRIWMIAGMDVFESRFVVPGWLWSSSVVVDPEQSRWYFGEPRMVPNSDHFSIAKPTKDKNSADHYPHEYLMEFYELRFVPEIRALSRCQSSAASHPSSFAEYFSRMRDGVRPARDVGIQVAQLGSDVFPGSVDQACYTAKLSELRQRQSLQAVGGVRCEGEVSPRKGKPSTRTWRCRSRRTCESSARPRFRVSASTVAIWDRSSTTATTARGSVRRYGSPVRALPWFSGPALGHKCKFWPLPSACPRGKKRRMPGVPALGNDRTSEASTAFTSPPAAETRKIPCESSDSSGGRRIGADRHRMGTAKARSVRLRTIRRGRT